MNLKSISKNMQITTDDAKKKWRMTHNQRSPITTTNDEEKRPRSEVHRIGKWYEYAKMRKVNLRLYIVRRTNESISIELFRSRILYRIKRKKNTSFLFFTNRFIRLDVTSFDRVLLSIRHRAKWKIVIDCNQIFLFSKSRENIWKNLSAQRFFGILH